MGTQENGNIRHGTEKLNNSSSLSTWTSGFKESAIAGGIVRSPVSRTPKCSLQLLCVAANIVLLKVTSNFRGGGYLNTDCAGYRTAACSYQSEISAKTKQSNSIILVQKQISTVLFPSEVFYPSTLYNSCMSVKATSPCGADSSCTVPSKSNKSIDRFCL